MRRAEKEQVVEQLSARVGQAKCLYLTDFTGLDVEAMTELRRRLSGAEVEYVVVKNTLARRALADGPYAGLSGHLEGPNAFAMSRADVVSAAKILTEFAGERERPTIKAGAIEGRIVSLEEIRRLAELPPREQLLAQLVGYARAPIAGLVYTLSGLLTKLVRTLDAVRADREATETATGEPAAAAEGAVEARAAEAADEAGESAGQAPAETAEETADETSGETAGETPPA